MMHTVPSGDLQPLTIAEGTIFGCKANGRAGQRAYGIPGAQAGGATLDSKASSASCV